MEGALQALEETAYWLELLAESGIVPPARFHDLLDETSQLTAIFVTAVRTTKHRKTHP